MDHIDIKKNKSKKNETKIEELLNENKQDLQIMDVSIFDDTLKEIDKIINNLEQKIHIVKSGTEKLDVLPEIKSVISKIHEAKNELVKEENSLIKNNSLNITQVNTMLDNMIEVFLQDEDYEKCHVCNEIKKGLNNVGI